MKKRGGFSLMEVLIASFIMILLVGILMASLAQVRMLFQTTDIMALLQSHAHLALHYINTDLSKTSSSQVSIVQNNPVAGSDAIQYRLPSDSDGDGQPDLDASGNIVWNATALTIQIDAVATQELRKYVDGTSDSTLTPYIKSIRFIDHWIDPSLYLDELRVDIALEESDDKGRPYSISMTSLINMRN